KQNAGDDARLGGAIAHHRDHAPLGAAQRRRGFAQAVGHQHQHVVGGAHHYRYHQDRQRQRTRPARIVAHLRHIHGVDEQADDDRRRRQQHVVQEAGGRREPAALPVLGQVGAGQDAYRRTHQRAYAGHQQAAHDGVDQPALLPGRRRDFGEQRQRQGGRALEHQRKNDPEQPEQPEQQGRQRDGQHHAVDQPAPAVDAVVHVEHRFSHDDSGYGFRFSGLPPWKDG